MRDPILKVLLVLLFISISVSRSHAGNTYYVASGYAYENATNVPARGYDDRFTNINNSGKNRGSMQYPFFSIQYAAKQAYAGDTVIVRDGVYYENVYLGLDGGNNRITSQSGTASAYINFTSEHNGLAYVRSSATYDGCFHIKSADQNDVGWGAIAQPIAYIDIHGFDLQSWGYDGKGVVMTWAHHISVRDCNIHDSGAGGIASIYSDYDYLEGNDIRNCCRTSSYNGSGISIFKIRPWDNYTWAGGYHNIIKRNTCYNNYIEAGKYNIFKDQDGTYHLISHTDGNGIIVDTSYLNVSMLIDDNLVYNNGGRGIINDGVPNVDILNNTCYKNNIDSQVGGTEEINCQKVTWESGVENSICRNVLVRDNICWPADWKHAISIDGTSENITVTNNWLYSGVGYSGSGSGNTLITYPWWGYNWNISGNYGAGMPYSGGNPLFVSPGNGPTANFHLQYGSGCKDKSVSHPQYDRDYYPRPYNGWWDLGAYEYH